MGESSEYFAKCKTKEEVIKCYLSRIRALEKIAQHNYAITSNEFQQYLYFNFFDKYKVNGLSSHGQTPTPNKRKHDEDRLNKQTTFEYNSSNKNLLFSKTSMKNFAKFLIKCICNKLKRYIFGIAIVLTIIVLVNYKLEGSNLFMRNIQTLIYPGMRLWRKFTLPLIEQFPHLTELYDETCLIENPLFQVAGMDCAPCMNVVNVMDLSIATNFLQYFDYSVPHIMQMNKTKSSSSITLPLLHSMYMENRKNFKENAYKVYSTNTNIQNLDHLFDALLLNKTKYDDKTSHNLWRVNRMAPARILRTIFPTPKSLPLHAAIGIERYIAFDTVHSASYRLPTADCSNMFVYQARGSRTIHLQPTKECEQQCRRTSVRLKENFILFYDWWYWKPISATDQFAKKTSISYIGSYC